MFSNIEQLVSIISTLPLLYFPMVGLIGLLVGSFLNVVIFRTPKMMEQEFRTECCDFLQVKNTQQELKITLSSPNSTCPSCKTPIKPWHNIPVISYFLLKGKCAACSHPISIRYPIIEAVTGALSILTVWVLGFHITALVALFLLWALIALTMIDADTQLLPDSITLPLLWLGLIANSASLYVDLSDAVWGAVAGYLSLWCVYWLFKLVTGKEGMGYGDFKLLAALGAWMGWQFLPLIILLSSFVGAAIGIAGIIIYGRDKNIPMPFGPYLAIAGWLAFLWGDQIIDYYFQFLGV